MKFGLPKGSILDLQTFLLCINDLPHHVSTVGVVLFAVDTSIQVIDKNKLTLQEKIKRLMIQLGSWFSRNNLAISTDKTKAMIFQVNEPYDMT